MPKFAVILPAAGGSTRFGKNVNGPITGVRNKKVFVELKGRPVWIRAAEVFLKHDDVVQTLIVIAPDGFDPPTTPPAGSPRRFDRWRCG